MKFDEPFLALRNQGLILGEDGAPDHHLFLLPGDTPAKPGLLRVGADGGAAIDVEIWAMPAQVAAGSITSR